MQPIFEEKREVSWKTFKLKTNNFCYTSWYLQCSFRETCNNRLQQELLRALVKESEELNLRFIHFCNDINSFDYGNTWLCQNKELMFWSIRWMYKNYCGLMVSLMDHFCHSLCVNKFTKFRKLHNKRIAGMAMVSFVICFHDWTIVWL